MYKNILIVSIGVCMLLVAVYLFLHEEKVVNYPPKNKTVVAFGDSLVFGYGASQGNDFVSLLSQRIGRNIVNLGVSGDTTRDGLARVEEVRRYDPGVVLVLLGGNDTLRKVPEADTRDNLARIIENFQKDGAVVVLLGVRGGALRDDRAVLYNDLHEKYGTLYLSDVLEGIFLRPERMFDGIHPNDVGYAIIADRLAELFREKKL